MGHESFHTECEYQLFHYSDGGWWSFFFLISVIANNASTNRDGSEEQMFLSVCNVCFVLNLNLLTNTCMFSVAFTCRGSTAITCDRCKQACNKAITRCLPPQLTWLNHVWSLGALRRASCLFFLFLFFLLRQRCGCVLGVLPRRFCKRTRDVMAGHRSRRIFSLFQA